MAAALALSPRRLALLEPELSPEPGSADFPQVLQAFVLPHHSVAQSDRFKPRHLTANYK
jgi:hypothetical protein